MSGLEHSVTAQAAARPHAPAFEFAGEVLSYGDLKAQALALAAQLQSLGVARGDRVGIYMTKGLEMPVAIYGIFYAGAAFVPLDPAAPPERIAGLITDCGISVMVSAARMEAPLAALAPHVPALTVIGADAAGLTSHPRQMSAAFTPAENAPGDIAYIIFTSGSTGTPKGIVHTHGSGSAYAQMSARLYPLAPGARVGNYVPLHFDISTFDFLYAPMMGATTVMLPEIAAKMPAMLSEILQNARIEVFYTVPFALIGLEERGALDKRDLSALSLVIFGGEPMPPTQLAALMDRLPGVRFSNSYGPAETNQITELTVPADLDTSAALSVGAACDHVELRLDAGGILLAHGPSQMRGYWNRPDLDAKAFCQIDGKRFYVTGDVMRLGADGAYHFAGRSDRQVKIRGYRVELDEVELVLGRHEAVSEAAVIVAPGGLTLSAFVTLAPGKEADAPQIRAHAQSLLPAYAVPHEIDVIEAFARTTSGKIDRRALLECVA